MPDAISKLKYFFSFTVHHDVFGQSKVHALPLGIAGRTYFQLKIVFFDQPPPPTLCNLLVEKLSYGPENIDFALNGPENVNIDFALKKFHFRPLEKTTLFRVRSQGARTLISASGILNNLSPLYCQ